ncbi:lactonase family protein [Paenibacillus campi]|uniref:lactonase family protein n=1 Tax=Paenibacillus campi TaxID=3106031 RepID=UPI002AFE7088|nr:lactonase family protein [Paenibacillus sp. SGZ-1014]
MTKRSERMLVFVGSYAESTNPGVYVYEFDETTAELTATDSFAGLQNPTFLNVDAAARRLYALGETVSETGSKGKGGEAAAFVIDAEHGKLELLNRVRTIDGPPCHIGRSADSRYLTMVSYHGGMVGLIGIKEDGSVGELLDVHQHEGHSVDPQNQDRPHPHSTFFDPAGKYALVQDLGLDRVRTYELVQSSNELKFVTDAVSAPGAGPRHLVFHPNGNFAFIINELNATVTAYQYEASTGTLTEVQTITTLPANYDGANGCAEIAISEDGRYVYGSNRGHDSIVQYAVNAETGELTLVQHVSTEGGHPRHFSLLPGGRYALVANRDGNNIVVFSIDADSGKLTYTGKSTAVSKPVCVWGARF